MITETKVAIDWQLASDILDRLGYSLQDLSLDFGDVIISDGDISHVLYYSSHHSTFNSMGSIWVENGIYYAKPDRNHRTHEMAALDLLDPELVQATAAKILLERQLVPDYF